MLTLISNFLWSKNVKVVIQVQSTTKRHVWKIQTDYFDISQLGLANIPLMPRFEVKVKKNRWIIQQVSKLFFYNFHSKKELQEPLGSCSPWYGLKCIHESLVVSKYGSGHSRPRLADAQSSTDIISRYYLSLLMKQNWLFYITKSMCTERS